MTTQDLDLSLFPDPDTDPDPTQLRLHLAVCVAAQGRMPRLQAAAQTVHAFLAPRFLSTVVVVSMALMALCLFGS